MVGRRGEALGTYPAVVFRGLDQPSRHATSHAAGSGSLSPSIYPPWDGHQLETRTYVGCRNEPDDTHPLAATTEKRIDLVDAADEARPRFPAGRKPGTVGSRRIGWLVLRRDLDEDPAPKCDSAISVRVCPVVTDELGSPVGNVGSVAGDPFQVVVVPVAGRHPLFPVIGDGPPWQGNALSDPGQDRRGGGWSRRVPGPCKAPLAAHPGCRESPSRRSGR